MQSMTGFAIKTFLLTTARAQTEVSLSLKSLNSRFFEVICRLPQPLQHLETQFIKQLKKQLHRGTIQLSIQVSNSNFFKNAISVDTDLAKNYLAAAQKLQKDTKVPGAITITDLINLPNLFIAQETTVDEKTKATIEKNFQTLVDQLVAERTKEGAMLAQDLQKRTKNMRQEITAIEKQANNLMQQKKQEVAEQLQQFKELPEEQLKTQRMLLDEELNKMDIHEEIIRFQAHLKAFALILENKDVEKGRRLDFLLQELGRETNTIAAKCADAQISAYAINLKVELEKAREQVQNIV
jgi:uncharacterized protein (TIGR00255 family)